MIRDYLYSVLLMHCPVRDHYRRRHILSRRASLFDDFRIAAFQPAESLLAYAESLDDDAVQLAYRIACLLINLKVESSGKWIDPKLVDELLPVPFQPYEVFPSP